MKRLPRRSSKQTVSTDRLVCRRTQCNTTITTTKKDLPRVPTIMRRGFCSYTEISSDGFHPWWAVSVMTITYLFVKPI